MFYVCFYLYVLILYVWCIAWPLDLCDWQVLFYFKEGCNFINTACAPSCFIVIYSLQLVVGAFVSFHYCNEDIEMYRKTLPNP